MYMQAIMAMLAIDEYPKALTLAKEWSCHSTLAMHC